MRTIILHTAARCIRVFLSPSRHVLKAADILPCINRNMALMSTRSTRSCSQLWWFHAANAAARRRRENICKQRLTAHFCSLQTRTSFTQAPNASVRICRISQTSLRTHTSWRCPCSSMCSDKATIARRTHRRCILSRNCLHHTCSFLLRSSRSTVAHLHTASTDPFVHISRRNLALCTEHSRLTSSAAPPRRSCSLSLAKTLSYARSRVAKAAFWRYNSTLTSSRCCSTKPRSFLIASNPCAIACISFT